MSIRQRLPVGLLFQMYGTCMTCLHTTERLIAARRRCANGGAALCGLLLRKSSQLLRTPVPQAFFDGTSTGELLTRLTVDVSRLSAAVADNLGQRGVRSLFEVSDTAFTSCCRRCVRMMQLGLRTSR